MNMKKSLLFCVVLLMAIVMKAQLTVDNFEQRINDQSGMATNTSVRVESAMSPVPRKSAVRNTILY